MLVITRRKHERLLIGDDIEIVVVDIGRRSVRLGISAPKDVPLTRADVAEPKDPKDERE